MAKIIGSVTTTPIKTTIDDKLSPTSTNPVQNCVVTGEVIRIDTAINTAQETANAAGYAATYAKNAVDNNIIPRITALEQNGGGGGITVTDDGDGNVEIIAYAGVSITDDGNGNVTIV